MKTLLILVLSAVPAGAVCTSFSPYDPKCSVHDILNHTQANPAFYAGNSAARQARIAGCLSLNIYLRDPPAWCAAAFAAQRSIDGSQYGRHP